jgi:hypothetical protein
LSDLQASQDAATCLGKRQSYSITSSARASSAGGTATQHPDPMNTLLVSLDRLDQMLRVRIRQNFRIQAGQCGFERLPVDFCDSHA